ncbi:hypothetical protein PENSPDRAFT_682198 [Peniophora sp. CONT]|nr:hypothetical protein PENSPDRAFT_682198 [Peniophora sp. CONT]
MNYPGHSGSVWPGRPIQAAAQTPTFQSGPAPLRYMNTQPTFPVGSTPGMHVPTWPPNTSEYPKLDRLVAGALALRGNDSLLTALQSLNGAQGYSYEQWSEYYLLRSDDIHPLVEGLSSVSNKKRSDLQSSAANEASKEPRDNLELPPNSISPEGGPSRRSTRPAASSLKRGHSSKQSDEHRTPKRRANSGLSGVTSTPADLQAMVEWEHSHGEAWKSMGMKERWVPFAEKHGIRTPTAWNSLYNRKTVLGEIQAGLKALREKDTGSAQEREGQ